MRYHVFPSEQHPLLNIYSIGVSGDPQITRFGPGQRNQYIVHYVLSGKGYFNDLPVTAGQGFLIRPKTMQKGYYPDETDPWEFLWIISSDPQMEKLFCYYNENPQNQIFQYNFVEKLQQIARWVTENTGTFIPQAKMMELFLDIFNAHLAANSRENPSDAAHKYIEIAMRYIEASIHEPVTVTELTRHLHISQPYLFKIFKDAMQISPKAYIMERKLSRAKELLESTDMRVAQVASSVGFDNPLAFSRFFKKHAGCAPRNYRKKQAE